MYLLMYIGASKEPVPEVVPLASRIRKKILERGASKIALGKLGFTLASRIKVPQKPRKGCIKNACDLHVVKINPETIRNSISK